MWENVIQYTALGFEPTTFITTRPGLCLCATEFYNESLVTRNVFDRSTFL